MLMPTSPHNPITHASIKTAILYNFSSQNPKMWRNASKQGVAFEDFYDS